MNPSSYKKILIINPFGIGDVLFTTPLVSNIKRHFPQIFIGYVGNRRTMSLLDKNPKIDRVFVYERDEFNAAYRDSKVKFIAKGRDFLREIKKERFDLVIDLSLNSWMSFLMWLIGIPRRIGFNYRNRSGFLTGKIPLKGYEERHVVEFYLDLLKHLDIPVVDRKMEIFPSAEDERFARDWLARQGIQPGKAVALVPGGGASWGKSAFYKRWSVEKYAKLADKIVENFGLPIILMGDKNEKELCREVGKLMRQQHFEICGETSVLQFAAVLQLCAFAVVNDGGPLHVAVAAGVKTVSFFGPVDERVYGPYPPENHLVIAKNIPCRPCYRCFRMSRCEHISCLRALTVEEAWERINRKFKQGYG